jgi:predicted metal-dependent hydrolase
MASTPAVQGTNPGAIWSSAEEFKVAVAQWADRIGVKPARIQLRRMRRKWASCSLNGVVTFSTDLLSTPREFGEAVIAHELLHLQVPNHGALFKRLLQAHMPGAPVLLELRGRVAG